MSRQEDTHWFDDLARKLAGGSPQPRAELNEGAGAQVHARRTRRQFVKATAAVTAGIGGAAYVKPSLQAFGVPVALAVSGPHACTGQGDCPPGTHCLNGACVPIV
jgi:hypothetical protein